MESIKHCYIAIDLLYLSNQEKKQQSLRFKFAEIKSHLRLWKCKELPQTYRKLADMQLWTTHCYFAEFAVAKWSLNLLRPPLLKNLSTAALEVKEVLYWTNSFFSAASAKELSSTFFADTADRNSSIHFAASSLFGSDWLNKQPKNSLLLTDSTLLSLSPLSLLALLVHSSTC